MNPVASFAHRIRSIYPWLALASLALSLCAGCTTQEKKTPSAAASASAHASGLPANVEPQLLGKIKELANSCQIDLRESEVNCKNRGLETLNDQFVQGARSQSRSLDTLAYALALPDEKVSTVAAEILSRSFRAPSAEKDPKPTSNETALSLIKTLSKLHDLQALDAAPAMVFAAFQTGTEKELYAAVENHPYKRLVSRTYRYLMAAGGMRAWDKVQSLTKHERIEVATSALDAPTLFRDKTPEDRGKICDWYRSLTDDPRRGVSTRASGYLIVCGPVYIEQLLAADEERVKDKKLTKLPLGSYQQMCAPAMISATGPTPEQCGRLRKLLSAVLEDSRFDMTTRVEALTMLTVNFSDKETLAQMKKYSRDKDPVVADRASTAATQLTQDFEAAARRAAAAKKAGTTAAGLKPTDKRAEEPARPE